MTIEKIEKLAKIALENGRDYSNIKEVKQITGGSINDAYYVQTTDAEFFMKFHADAPKFFFKTEATGLRLIKETNTISVPNYLSYSTSLGTHFFYWNGSKESAQKKQKRF